VRGRAASAEMVDVGVALMVDSRVGVGVVNSIIVGVGVGVTVVFCFSKVWVISRICCLSCLDCEKRKTAAAIATPAMRRIIMVMKTPNEEPPLGMTVTGISCGGIGAGVGSNGWEYTSLAGVAASVASGDLLAMTSWGGTGELKEGSASGVSSKAGAEVAGSWLFVIGSWIGKEVSMGGVENGSIETWLVAGETNGWSGSGGVDEVGVGN